MAAGLFGSILGGMAQAQASHSQNLLNQEIQRRKTISSFWEQEANNPLAHPDAQQFAREQFLGLSMSDPMKKIPKEYDPAQTMERYVHVRDVTSKAPQGAPPEAAQSRAVAAPPAAMPQYGQEADQGVVPPASAYQTPIELPSGIGTQPPPVAPPALARGPHYTPEEIAQQQAYATQAQREAILESQRQGEKWLSSLPPEELPMGFAAMGHTPPPPSSITGTEPGSSLANLGTDYYGNPIRPDMQYHVQRDRLTGKTTAFPATSTPVFMPGVMRGSALRAIMGDTLPNGQPIDDRQSYKVSMDKASRRIMDAEPAQTAETKPQWRNRLDAKTGNVMREYFHPDDPATVIHTANLGKPVKTVAPAGGPSVVNFKDPDTGETTVGVLDKQTGYIRAATTAEGASALAPPPTPPPGQTAAPNEKPQRVPARSAAESATGRKEVMEAFNNFRDAGVRLDTMEKTAKNLETSKTPGPGDMVLLSNHLAMTFGAVKGARLSKDLIQAHEEARTLGDTFLINVIERIRSGAKLTPEQRTEFVRLGRERYDELQEAYNKTKATWGYTPPGEADLIRQKAPPGGTFDVTDPRGIVHHFATQAQANQFKQAAGIK